MVKRLRDIVNGEGGGIWCDVIGKPYIDGNPPIKLVTDPEEPIGSYGYIPKIGDVFPSGGALIDALISSNWEFEMSGRLRTEFGSAKFFIDAANRDRDLVIHIEVKPINSGSIRISRVDRV